MSYECIKENINLWLNCFNICISNLELNSTLQIYYIKTQTYGSPLRVKISKDSR